jgi:soluble lytic murein transglycosylase-like protein
MGGMKARLAAFLLVFPAPTAAEPLDRWSPQIAEASRRFKVPEEWIRRVIRAESGGRTSFGGRPIMSRAGAMGLMQVMPGTWREMRAAHGLGADPHNPRDNILAGTAYLRAMYVRFGYPGLFAAYNAGPARYAEHLAKRRRLPAETRAYMAAVAGAAIEPNDSGLVPGLAPAPAIFAVLTVGAPASRAVDPREPPTTEKLFIRLSDHGSR